MTRGTSGAAGDPTAGDWTTATYSLMTPAEAEALKAGAALSPKPSGAPGALSGLSGGAGSGGAAGSPRIKAAGSLEVTPPAVTGELVSSDPRGRGRRVPLVWPNVAYWWQNDAQPNLNPVLDTPHPPLPPGLAIAYCCQGLVACPCSPPPSSSSAITSLPACSFASLPFLPRPPTTPHPCLPPLAPPPLPPTR
jgi:hypothetical protein